MTISNAKLNASELQRKWQTIEFLKPKNGKWNNNISLVSVFEKENQSRVIDEPIYMYQSVSCRYLQSPFVRFSPKVNLIRKFLSLTTISDFQPLYHLYHASPIDSADCSDIPDRPYVSFLLGYHFDMNGDNYSLASFWTTNTPLLFLWTLFIVVHVNKKCALPSTVSPVSTIVQCCDNCAFSSASPAN